MPRIKRSYGLICCRNDKRGFSIILIKKHITYYFNEFVSGCYVKNDDAHLKKLFNNMTYYEKMDILSFNYTNMWYRVYRNNPDKQRELPDYIYRQYIKNKNKFEKSFLQDKGERIKSLISDTINSETIWEIPKGRRSETRREEQIDTAIREFTEETRINENNYEIMWHLTPYVESYSDFGTTYINVYFFARAVKEFEPAVKFNDGVQTAEVCEIKWCNLDDIMHMRLDPKTHARLIKMFKKVAKKYKNAIRKTK